MTELIATLGLWLAVGAFIGIIAQQAGYIKPMLSIVEVVILALFWPYTIHHVWAERKRRMRRKPPESYFEKWGGGDET